MRLGLRYPHDAKSMLWKERYVTTRRHPLAFATYLVTLVFGLLFATGILDTSVVFSELNPIWQILWEWELVSGGAVAAISLFVRPRVFPHWPDLADVLRFEGIGGLVGGLGMGTYAIVLVSILGLASYAWVLMTILALGMIYRGIQAIVESSRVERLGALNDAAQSVLSEAHRVHLEQGGYIPLADPDDNDTEY